MSGAETQFVQPTLTAARRMRLQRRAQVSVVVASTPFAILVGTYGYKLGVGLSEMRADAVTAWLGYVFGVASALSALLGAQSLFVLRARYRLDTTQISYSRAWWCSIVAVAAAPVWLVLRPWLAALFYGEG